MKKKLTWTCLVVAAAVCIAGMMHAQSEGQRTWNQENAVSAFTAALSRSAYDQAFRDRLTASPESAKQAVAEEGQIAIPSEIVIMFHEAGSNGNYHIFDLPEFDGDSSGIHPYKAHYECCYPVW